MGLSDFDAEYDTQAANLGLQQKTTLGNIESVYGTYNPATGKWSGGSAEAGERYQEGRVSEAEPETYRQNANAANRGGLLRSGINARRMTDIAGRFAAQRAGNQLELSNKRVEGLNQKRQAETDYTTGIATAATNRKTRQSQWTEEHPPAVAAGPSGPGWGYTVPAQAASSAAPIAGGVVPYQTSNVNVGYAGPANPNHGQPGAPPIKWSSDPKVRQMQQKRGW